MIKRFLRLLGIGRTDSVEHLRKRLGHFRDLVRKNDRVLALIADAGEKMGGDYLFDGKYLQDLAAELKEEVGDLILELTGVTGQRHADLLAAVSQVDETVRAAMEFRVLVPNSPLVFPMEEIRGEHAEAVGQKMARLGEIGAQLRLPIPRGFVLTTRACQQFLEAAGLDLDAMTGGLAASPEEDPRLSPQEIEERILATRLPKALDKELRKAVASMEKGEGDLRFAVRSSALGEDGDLTGAGQFKTLLGVDPKDLADAYREVVASLWSAQAVAYYRSHGVAPGQGLMAVGFHSMVPARSSGVAYSVDPLDPAKGTQTIAAAWGLGKAVVDGEEPVDRFEVHRAPGFPVASSRLEEKRRRFDVAGEGGVETREVEESKRGVPALTDAEVAQVADATCRIERYMKLAQDVEWALAADGSLTILQVRPLKLRPPDSALERKLAEVPDQYPVLMSGRGEVACQGIGYGRVLVVDGPMPPDLPAGMDTVLVTRSASPSLGGYVSGASAILTDLGNPTGHFATVAREARVPTIVGTKISTATFRDGQEITVDAEENIIYEGRVEELLHYQLVRRSSFEDAPEFQALKGMLRHIAPLHLHDPQGKDFSPGRCVTYHDIVRFAHEKAVASLTNMAWIQPDSDIDCVRRLKTTIPLDLILVDLGGGIAPEAEGKTVSLEDVRSKPLIPLLGALCGEGGWETKPASMDLNGFMSSATRSLSLTTPNAARPAQNLAIVSEEYLHLSLRLGYHFNVVDTFLTEDPTDNYIYFRFLGGVTELTRRSRRGTLLRRILEKYGFVVEGKQDLVIGRTRALPEESMLEQMWMVGRLIGFIRQLDIFMTDDSAIEKYEEQFMAGGETRAPH